MADTTVASGRALAVVIKLKFVDEQGVGLTARRLFVAHFGAFERSPISLAGGPKIYNSPASENPRMFLPWSS